MSTYRSTNNICSLLLISLASSAKIEKNFACFTLFMIRAVILGDQEHQLFDLDGFGMITSISMGITDNRVDIW